MGQRKGFADSDLRKLNLRYCKAAPVRPNGGPSRPNIPNTVQGGFIPDYEYPFYPEPNPSGPGFPNYGHGFPSGPGFPPNRPPNRPGFPGPGPFYPEYGPQIFGPFPPRPGRPPIFG